VRITSHWKAQGKGQRDVSNICNKYKSLGVVKLITIRYKNTYCTLTIAEHSAITEKGTRLI
jgi:hypothetical protein